MAIRTIGDGGINWNWYLSGEFNEDERTVHILYHERWHKYEGDRHPKAEWPTTGGLTLMEDGDRTLYGVKIGGIEYLVTNPSYVFGYKDFSKIVMED